MKTPLILLITLLSLQTVAVRSQNMETPPRSAYGPIFVRVYPLELIMHEIRMGVEVPTTYRQAIVLDGSYFWGGTDNTVFREGWALKMDYRFYLADPGERVRFFVGPNLMVKGQRYQQEVYNSSSLPTYNTVPRMVYCGNVKTGVDVALSKEGRARLELFSGVGVRYQSLSESLGLGWGDSPSGPSTSKNGRIVPNLLLGVLVKF